MSILNVTTNITGFSGVIPRPAFIQCDNSYDEVIELNFLQTVIDMGYQFNDIGIIYIWYGDDANTLGQFVPVIDSSGITLAPYIGEGNVTLPVVSGDIAIFDGTTGKIESTANLLTDFQEFIPLTDILINSVGTWTRTRVAQGNYSLVHTVANDTSVIGVDISPQLRAASSRGFRLASIDVIYTIATDPLDAHTLTLDSIAYANNVAVSVTSVALTGSLATATQAQPYVTNIAVTTPAFLNTSDAKYCLELTVNNSATSVYSFYGLNLHFSQTIA